MKQAFDEMLAHFTDEHLDHLEIWKSEQWYMLRIFNHDKFAEFQIDEDDVKAFIEIFKRKKK